MTAREPQERRCAPAPKFDTCKTCGRRLTSAKSRLRGYGTLHWAQYVAAHPWMAWHHRPPRLGHLPHGDEPCEGQAVLFPVQPMLPGDGEERR